MTPGVIPDRVAAFNLPPHDARIGGDGSADNEECRTDVLGAQNRDDLVGVGRVWPVVVGQRNDSLVFGPLTSVLPKI